jgi:hypothetical protein
MRGGEVAVASEATPSSATRVDDSGLFGSLFTFELGASSLAEQLVVPISLMMVLA